MSVRYVGPEIFFLEHWQNTETNRSGYLRGLAVDCFEHPDNDRNSHYFAREMMWLGRPKSAIKEFERHIAMNRWDAERAQSYIFMGDCYGRLNQPEKQVECYHKAFYVCPKKRESLLKLAHFFRANNNPQSCAAYAEAALTVPWSGFYADSRADYEDVPHSLLYWAYGWVGNVPKAQEHILKCLDYQREHPEYIRDTKFYFEYPANTIAGWMHPREQFFLFDNAKKMESVVELGSWKGKSSHALLSSGCPSVTCIDHWKGSKDEPQAHAEARSGTLFEDFKRNVGHFKNLTIVNADINDVVDKYLDHSIDMVFIDAGHTYEEVKNDIRKWKPKTKILLCGHDYTTEWAGVKQAVDEELGGPDEVIHSIWVKWLVKPKVSICIPTLGRPDKLNRLLNSIKENAGYDNYEVIVKADEFPPNNVGAPKMLAKCVAESTGDLVMFLGNDCVMEPNCLREAVWEMARRFPEMDGMIGLNDSYWKKEHVAPHWLASKKLLPALDGEFFHTGYYHAGCDNELMARVEKMGKYAWAEKAKIFHDHPMMSGKDKTPMDELYAQCYWGPRHDHDNELYAERAKKYGFEGRF